MSDDESGTSQNPPPSPPPPPIPERCNKKKVSVASHTSQRSSSLTPSSSPTVEDRNESDEGSEDGERGDTPSSRDSPPRPARDPYDNHILFQASSVNDNEDVHAASDFDDDDKQEVNGADTNGRFQRGGNAETGEKRYSLKIPVEDSHSQVVVDVGDYLKPVSSKMYKNNARERFFFENSFNSKRIDYVLVFEDVTDEDKISKRESYEKNLKEEGLELEFHDMSDSVNGKSNFTLVHATWDALLPGAELMNMQKKLKMPKNVQGGTYQCCNSCGDPFAVGEPIVREEDDYFTSGFNRNMIDTFDIDMDHKEDFFTNAERSLIVKEILDRSSFIGSKGTSKSTDYGIHKLIRSGVYTAEFPIHEGPHILLTEDESSDTKWEGPDKDRARLYEAWARPGRWYCYQPLDLIRTYFGEKIGIYFAWLGFYTAMLIPASLVGTAVFIYGIITIWQYPPVNDVCDKSGVGGATMCPVCDNGCTYWKLSESCLYSKITYLFDNWATVAFAAFMSLWATVFLEFWKRKQKEMQYDWDVDNFELEERMRPEFEMKVRHTKVNPITLDEEPYVPWYESLPRQGVSLIVILFFICLVVAAILSVIMYRIVVVALFYAATPDKTLAKLVTSITASIINLLVIIILNLIYKRVAMFLTQLERPRTDTEFEDSFTFKMFLFQFVNFYGSIFYIAFFKGKFSIVPGLKRNYLFGSFRQDTCDPSGCIIDLFIQLAIVMVGKQMINNSKELLIPVVKSFCRVKGNKKRETQEQLYMRWQQDNDLPPAGDLGLFEEYLEMVIQYGFVTIFVAAFPLAPVFALLNNVIEIRLDAYKFCKAWRRGPAVKAQDIGIWFGILQSITFIAILSNAFIIGWTSDFIPKVYYLFSVSQNQTLNGYIESSLSFFSTKDFLNDTEPVNATSIAYCRFKGYLEDPRNVSQPHDYNYTKEYWHIFAGRLSFVLIFEHTIFLLTWLLSVLIPDTPSRVKRLVLYEFHLNKKLKFDAAFGESRRLRGVATDLMDQRDGQGARENDYD